MKILIAILVFLGIANLVLAFKRKKDEDEVFEKSQTKANNKAIRGIREMRNLNAKIEQNESAGLCTNREKERFNNLSKQLDTLNPNSGIGGSSSGGFTGSLKRF